MAETTGLVLGTLALVGVFEDCVVLISQIAAAKSMGQDYEILDTKLDIEKTLLLQWADRMHLFEQQRYDERLDDPETQEITKRALGCIRQLLQNGTEFQTRYGMQPVEGDSSLQPTSTISHRLMSNFRKDRKLWQLKSLLDQNQKKQQIQDSAHDGRSGISTLTKIRWVVKDKERFEFLVRDLSDLVASLHRILPPLHHDVSTRGRLQSEIKRVRDVGLLKTVLHASTGNNADLFTETRKAIAEECTRLILDRLWFRLIDDRQDNIAEAFPKTFEWAIHSPAAGLAWADLDRWLRKGRDIYWVSGKPGSGKSTLMKFLYQHPCVEWMLGEWAGERRLTMASFFLWNLGSREQNSQQGLARGLLYHVLNADPSLIPITLPGMWREANSGRIDLPFPSDKEMSQAFARLGTGVKNGAYVFFIDGLDEYVGDYRQGISFVQQLAKSPNIKVLLSSRPIDACVAAFSLKPKLALQDLTKDDIELYVTETVRSHPYMAELKALDNAVTERLVSDIQAKAAGVFLWVVLACRSLLEGFAAYDNPIELQSRVEELPPELEDLFRHILDRLSPRYLSQAAKLLRICYQSRLLAISDSIPTIALAWIDGKALSIRDPGVFKGLSHEEQNAKCEMLEGRLRSRCIGLLEVHRPATIQSGAHAGLVESSVDFMHRTVFEFLNSPGVWDLDCLQIDDEDFDATLALSYMSSYSLYLQKSPLTTSSYTSNLARQSLIYAQKIDKSYPSHTLFTLRLLALAIMQQGDKDPRPTYMYDTAKSRRSVNVKNHLLNPGSLFFGLDLEHLAPDDAALLLAVEANMANFVRSYDVAAYISSRSRNAHQQAKHYPLLYHGIKKPLLVKIHGFELQHPSSDIVRILLKAGCSPNEQFLVRNHETSTTPWETWRNLPHRHIDSHEVALQVAEVTVLMLQNGASLLDSELETAKVTTNQCSMGSLTNPEGDGSEVLAVGNWREDMIYFASTWLEYAENPTDGCDRHKLIECCDEIIRKVGEATTASDTPTHPPEALQKSSANSFSSVTYSSSLESNDIIVGKPACSPSVSRSGWNGHSVNNRSNEPSRRPPAGSFGILHKHSVSGGYDLDHMGEHNSGCSDKDIDEHEALWEMESLD